jgi:signal peptidase I
VTTNEPNPYAAPTAPLADGTAPGTTAQARPRRPSRAGAIVLSLFAYPLAGAGLYLLGRQRRALFWVIATIVLWTIMIAAIRTSQPKLCVVAMGAALASTLAALVDTAVAKAGEARSLGRAWMIAVALFLGGRGSALAVRVWIAEAFQIPSGAMIPTLLVGDHIFVKKGRAGIARGDVIVFEFPRDRSTDYVKRVVAIGGDTIEVRGGVPSINGVPLDHQPTGEPCVYRDDSGPPEDRDPQQCTRVRETNAGRAYTIMLSPGRSAEDFPRTTIPAGDVFVMGDNRDNSYDSRKWGTVPADAIKGVATLTWWSKAPNGPVRWSRVGHGVE